MAGNQHKNIKRIMDVAITLMVFAVLSVGGSGVASASAGGAEPVRIAIIDTGYFGKTEHDGLIFTNYDSRPKKGSITQVPTERKGYSSLHGTWVAGVIIDRIGVPADIRSYRNERSCYGDHCDLKVIGIVRAAYDAARNGAEIIQISSYGDFGDWGNRQMTALAERGIHIVICAGNEGGRSPLLSMAAMDTTRIHIIGSLTSAQGGRSSFSARDERGTKLLKWRRGENLRTFSPSGRSVRVTGTSYAASVFTAELANAIYESRRDGLLGGTLLANATRMETVDESVNTSEENERRSDDRVDLAASGEMSIAKLTPTERARLRSRAIRPEETDDVEASRVSPPPMENAGAPEEGGRISERKRSRARPPQK